MAKSPERVLNVAKHEILALFFAHNLNPEIAPEAAKCRSVSYHKQTLFNERKRAIATFIKPKSRKSDELVLLYNPNSAWSRSGWTTTYLREALRAYRNQHVIMLPVEFGTTQKMSFDLLYELYWCNPLSDDMERASILYVAKLFRYSLKKLKKVPAARYQSTKVYTPSARYGERDVEMRAKDILYHYSPEFKAKQRADRIENNLQERWNSQRYFATAELRRVRDELQHTLNGMARDIQETPALIKGILNRWGYADRDGMFKRCRHSVEGKPYSVTGHFFWPELGEWAPPVSGHIRTCSNGYHLVDVQGLCNWQAHGPHIYVAEGRGDHGDPNDNKIAFREARLVRYLGQITQDELQKAAGIDPATKQQKIAEAERALEVADLEYALAATGYGNCLAMAGSLEQDYVRFKIGANLEGMTNADLAR